MYSEEYLKSYNSGTSGTGFKSFLKAVLLGLVLTPIFILVFALLITYLPISENFLLPASILSILLPAFFCGISSARGAKSRGYLRGATAGFICAFFLALISMLIFDGFTFSSQMLLLFALGVISGAIGGIVGINFNTDRRKK